MMKLSDFEFKSGADGHPARLLVEPRTAVESGRALSIRVPGSKSLSNRALLLAALAAGRSELTGVLSDADDAQVMIAALRALGAEVMVDGTRVVVEGVSGKWKIARGKSVHLDLHNAGTATRFLVAAALLAPEGTHVVVDGDARMRQRPIGELVDAMNSVVPGAAEYVGQVGFPPVRIRGGMVGGDAGCGLRVAFGRTESSQFVSALMLVAPCMSGGIELDLQDDQLTSRSYVQMTLGLLAQVGVVASEERVGGGAHVRRVKIAEQRFCGFSVAIEPDASGATYAMAAGLLVPGVRVRIEGLGMVGTESLQGDSKFVEVIRACGGMTMHDEHGVMIAADGNGKDGLVRAFDIDLSDMPDTAMTAAALAMCAPIGMASTLKGLRTLRVKETDRILALQTELTKLGARVEVERYQGGVGGAQGEDELMRITPGVRPDGEIVIQTYHDHRMAMALSLLGLTERYGPLVIDDPGCVRKTWPGYWQMLAGLTG